MDKKLIESGQLDCEILFPEVRNRKGTKSSLNLIKVDIYEDETGHILIIKAPLKLAS